MVLAKKKHTDKGDTQNAMSALISRERSSIR